jgi:hypothetical protein
MKKHWISVAFLIVIVGCASTSKGPKPPEARAVAQFDKGYKFLETEDYTQASLIFETILVQNPATEFDMVAMFDAGAAREGMRDCKGAADRYRKVAFAAHGAVPQLKAQALYRLSFAYECLGDDTKVIASLLDVQKESGNLTEEIIRAELPARLAVAYARVGNSHQATIYFDQANRGLSELKNMHRTKAQYRDLIGRTLFFMGRVNLPDDKVKDRPRAYLENIRALQNYLYQAVEMEVPTWSERSLQQLHNAYEQLWSFVDDVHTNAQDPLIRENQDRKTRLDIAREAIKSLETLRNYQTTPEQPGGALYKLNFIISREQQKFNQLVASNANTTLPSLEDQKREGLRREGRTKK